MIRFSDKLMKAYFVSSNHIVLPLKWRSWVCCSMRKCDGSLQVHHWLQRTSISCSNGTRAVRICLCGFAIFHPISYSMHIVIAREQRRIVMKGRLLLFYYDFIAILWWFFTARLIPSSLCDAAHSASAVPMELSRTSRTRVWFLAPATESDWRVSITLR